MWHDALLIDSTDLHAAMRYGAMRTHEVGHQDFWAKLQDDQAVPRDIDYDTVPRGRVTFDTDKRIFYLFLDRCIRKRPAMISQIIATLDLPSPPSTHIRGDEHYRCLGCGYFDES